MRARHFVVGFAASVVVASVVFAGCGGSSSENGGTPDASNGDVAIDHGNAQVDTGNDVITDAAVCTVDADLATFQPPDASLGDSGATTGGCVNCTRQQCGPELSDCNKDCDCKGALIQFFACLQNGGQLLGCGQQVSAGLGPDTQATLQALGLCIYGGCKAQCNVPNINFDGGKDGASDAPSDAPGDGG